jgi:hypothetical protein
MSIIVLVLVLAVVGFLLYILLNNVAMHPAVKQLIVAVVAIGLVVWILQGFGLVSGFHFRP